ncbi:hypothetical protein UFOVP747_34 [uncultured Caudovirales phage]|uniref:Uncharacterized protein n=1 Tax=uncultured Caudovirales phage TaxID=2100421 RepID=A0A6J7X6M8_9CAUD|nr:hypothetical protein UFOVP675_65 [uncultured Caudovirales phage]CAB5225477.1 hypothetical protein UFOVP747_34 [uncultured Caudovirales phage]
MVKGWWRDERGVWEHDQHGCVAKDGRGAKPWGAYHTAKGVIGSAGHPNSWHATMREAVEACRAAREAQK